MFPLEHGFDLKVDFTLANGQKPSFSYLEDPPSAFGGVLVSIKLEDGIRLEKKCSVCYLPFG
jgi:hypothetical protein